jgi:hypothetical protein
MAAKAVISGPYSAGFDSTPILFASHPKIAGEIVCGSVIAKK